MFGGVIKDSPLVDDEGGDSLIAGGLIVIYLVSGNGAFKTRITRLLIVWPSFFA